MTTVTAFEARAPMRGGVRLTADVTLVDDGGPRPVILTRTPYSRAGARMSHSILRGGRRASSSTLPVVTR